MNNYSLVGSCKAAAVLAFRVSVHHRVAARHGHVHALATTLRVVVDVGAHAVQDVVSDLVELLDGHDTERLQVLLAL